MAVLIVFSVVPDLGGTFGENMVWEKGQKEWDWNGIVMTVFT